MKISSAIVLGLVLVSVSQAEVLLVPEAEANAVAEVAAIRKLYGEVGAMKLAVVETELEWEDEPHSGLLKLAKDGDGKVRRAFLSWGAEHGGWLVEALYDETGAPRFLLLEKNSWQFAGAEGETEDRATQTRFYFSPQRETVNVLRKAFVTTDGPEGMRAAADQAQNQVLNTPDYNGIQLQNLAAQLKSAKAPKAKALTEEFSQVLARLDEPAPSAKPAHWRKLEVPAALTIPNEEGADIRVLTYLMENGMVSEAGEVPEGNYSVTGFVLTGDPGHKESPVLQTLTTASGLMDDEIMAQRFLATFELNAKGQYELKSLGMQQKTWPNRGPEGWR